MTTSPSHRRCDEHLPAGWKKSADRPWATEVVATNSGQIPRRMVDDAYRKGPLKEGGWDEYQLIVGESKEFSDLARRLFQFMK